MDKPLRVGVIGVGTMGKNHARIYSESPNVELVGVADINAELASTIAQKYHTAMFTNYEELLKQKLDAVSIAVPTSSHKDIAINVAKAGINMLIEKPIADSVENAKKIIARSAEHNVRLMIGHVERFNPIMPAIKKSMENTNVISIEIKRIGPLPPRVKDVNVVIDLATHDIDLIRYLTNSGFKRTHCLTSSNLTQRVDSAILSFEMENGVLANVTVNWLTPFKVREIDISTSEKFIKGWFIEQKVMEFNRYEDGSYTARELKVPFVEPLKLELEAFLSSVRSRTEPPVTGEDGLETLDIAIQCLTKKQE